MKNISKTNVYGDLHRKVICLNNKRIFDDVGEASVFAQTDRLSILYCCYGVSTMAGAIQKEGLVWMFYDKFIKYSYSEIEDIFKEAKEIELKQKALEKKSRNSRHSKKPDKIVCVNTKEEYESLEDASEKTGISVNSIRNCCNKKSRYSTRNDGKKVTFRYYKEYKNLKETQIEQILKTVDKFNIKEVYNLKTNKKYDSAVKASKELGISQFTIRQQCNKGSNYSKTTMENGPEWMYYKDYLKMKEKMLEKC